MGGCVGGGGATVPPGAPAGYECVHVLCVCVGGGGATVLLGTPAGCGS